MRALLFGFCLCVITTPPQARAAGPERQAEVAGAEKVAKEAMEAARKLDWKRYAELVHPDSLRQFRDLFVPVLRSAGEKGGQNAADLLTLFEGAKDVNTVLGLGPREFFARLMTGMTSRAPLKEDFTGTVTRIVGTVPEGRDQAHVVTRSTRKPQGITFRKVDVLTLRRDRGQWKVMLPAELGGLAQTIRLMARTPPTESREDTIPADPEK